MTGIINTTQLNTQCNIQSYEDLLEQSIPCNISRSEIIKRPQVANNITFKSSKRKAVSKLLVMYPEGRVEKFELHEGDFIIGSCHSSDIRISDPNIASKHLELSFYGSNSIALNTINNNSIYFDETNDLDFLIISNNDFFVINDICLTVRTEFVEY